MSRGIEGFETEYLESYISSYLQRLTFFLGGVLGGEAGLQHTQAFAAFQ